MVRELWWHQHAACRGQGELFFPPDPEEHVTVRAEADRVVQAKKVCSSCPVASVCLDYAMKAPERYGIWGNATPRERVAIQHRIRRQQRRLAG